MSSSDIYDIKEPPWVKAQNRAPLHRRRRRKPRIESFDEATESKRSTRKRRSKNSGLRRFRHLMKQPEYSKRFWLTVASIVAILLIAVIVWDSFFRYPDVPPSIDESAFGAESESGDSLFRVQH